MRRIGLALSLAAVSLLAACGGGEFGGALVRAHVRALRCPGGRCASAPIPEKTYLQGRRIDDLGGGSAVVEQGGVSAETVSAGRYELAVPRLEHAGCRPRLRLQLADGRMYRLTFIFRDHGRCLARLRAVGPRP